MVSKQAPPIRVLVVDDDERARQTASDAFADQGCEVITVEDSDEAVRELRASPSVHLVFTDVNLSYGDNDDSGMLLGDYVKKIQPDVPVAVYSTVFTENELDAVLDSSARARFDVVVGRGGPKWDDDETIDQCVKLATGFRDRRAQSAAENADAESSDEAPLDLTIMRELVVRDFGDGGDSSPLTLKLLDVSLGDLRGSIAVWVLEHDAHFSVELYQRPDFHAAAATLSDALKGLGRLLQKNLESVADTLTKESVDWDAIPLLLLKRADAWDQRRGSL